MPDGKVHAKFTAIAAVTVMGMALAVGATNDQTFAVGTGALVGLLVHPDLDQAESRKDPWSTLWFPYGLLVKHRSWISHAPFISTAIRIGYLFCLAYLLWWLLTPRFPWLLSIPKLPYDWAAAGLAFADFVHIVLDIIVSAIKKIGGNDEVFVPLRRTRDYRD